MNLDKWKPQGEVSIQKVIADIREATAPFTIGWIRTRVGGKGKPKGGVVIIARAVYGAAEHEKRLGELSAVERQSANFKESGLLPITNYETNEFMTPLIGTIFFFNGFKVKH